MKGCVSPLPVWSRVGFTAQRLLSPGRAKGFLKERGGGGDTMWETIPILLVPNL